LALIISWFETDDIIQRLSVMFIMACLLGCVLLMYPESNKLADNHNRLTTNMLGALEHTYSMLVSFYLAARLFMGFYLLFLSAIIPMIRGMMISQFLLVLIPSGIWIASIHVEMPNRLGLVWVAIFIELAGPMGIILLIRSAKVWSESLGRWTNKVFEFYPAINIEHKVERTNAFVTLVFGYSVVAIIYQNAAGFGLNAFFGKACLGLVQAFCFNWIYFELDGADLHQHAIRRNVISGITPRTLQSTFLLISCSNDMVHNPPSIYYVLRPRCCCPLQTCPGNRLPKHEN
jgi:hypothetical protein